MQQETRLCASPPPDLHTTLFLAAFFNRLPLNCLDQDQGKAKKRILVLKYILGPSRACGAASDQGTMTMGASPSISIAVVGSGGAGALTTGNSLLEAACGAGWHGLFTRTMGPQIRGGEAAALLRLAVDPVESQPDQFDLLIGIDWLNAHRFGAEIKVGPQSLVISDPRGGEPPPIVGQSGARVIDVPMKELAKTVPDGRPNMIALGIAARLLGFTAEQLFVPVEKRLADKGPAAIEASRAAIRVGFETAADFKFDKHLAPPKPSSAKRWLLSGNEATALGAIRGGIRFAAAYPITPATDCLLYTSD